MSETQIDTTTQRSNSTAVADKLRDRLEEIATDRWGNAWTIVIEHYADGDVRGYAEHSGGLVAAEEHGFDNDARVLELERVWLDIDDDRMYYERTYELQGAEIVEDELVDLS